jgi:2-polyprenyl-3-methyl-5-hydroxy-6-metoxy-1,4-benzoquinol methylase
LSAGLAFLSDGSRGDYGRRLSRGRWRRALPAASELLELSPQDSARDFARADSWIFVRAETVLPAATGGCPVPPAGRVLLAASHIETEPPFLHTLREFEEASVRATAGHSEQGRAPAAISFRAADCPPLPGESAGDYFERILERLGPPLRDPAFFVLVFDDPSERERPELSSRVPARVKRLLDVGCGAGGTSAALKSRRPELRVTGIERDPRAAARARARLDRVIEGDAAAEIERLAAAGEMFDALLFADVLEHLEDPVRPLVAARALAERAATLVASVPNVGHLSLVRDLVLGRFDPVPAGLADAGHLRWFTKDSFVETLEEAGWRVVSVEPHAGAPPGAAEEFLEYLSGRVPFDRESLAAYQWIAIAIP